MGTRRELIITLFILQLFILKSLAISELYSLPGNRLREGNDRELPGATRVSCGVPKNKLLTVKETVSISEVLTGENVARYPFTAGPVASPMSPAIHGTEARFSLAVIKNGWSNSFALQVDDEGVKGYWLPQGGYIDIPRRPKPGSPKYVFTPDFSGCSWTITPLNNGKLRLRHVEGGAERSQFNQLTDEERGGPVTYAMEYKDYGYLKDDKSKTLFSNLQAFAYMRYMPFSGGNWILRFQRRACSVQTGGFQFTDGKVSKVTLVDFPKSTFPPVSLKNEYLIPNPDRFNWMR